MVDKDFHSFLNGCFDFPLGKVIQSDDAHQFFQFGS